MGAGGFCLILGIGLLVWLGQPKTAPPEPWQGQWAQAGPGGQTVWLDLAEGQLKLGLAGQTEPFWQSNPDWRVEHCALADIDQDGQTELMMAFWKKGSFGSSKPFWVTGPDDEYTNHLSVLNCQSGRVRVKWGSSKIPAPIQQMTTTAVQLREKWVPALKIKDAGGTGIWVWDQWGFTKLPSETAAD